MQVQSLNPSIVFIDSYASAEEISGAKQNIDKLLYEYEMNGFKSMTAG